MSDRFVTVASYASPLEGQMAKAMLEAEGVECILAGGLVADAFSGLYGFGDQVVLQVRADDAPRATSLLAAAGARASLDDDWEAQAEAGLWTCPLCGTPVAEGLPSCPACRTLREAVRPGPDDAVRRAAARPAPEAIRQPHDRLTAAPAPPPASKKDEKEFNNPGSRPGCLALAVCLALAALRLLLL